MDDLSLLPSPVSTKGGVGDGPFRDLLTANSDLLDGDPADACLRLAGRFGFTAMSVIDFGWRGADRRPQPRHRTTVVDDFANAYVQEGFMHADPVVSRAMGSTIPFLWRDCPAWHEATHGKKGPHSQGRRVMQAAFDFGYRDGQVIPVHMTDRFGARRSGLVTLFHEATVPQGLDWRERAVLQIAAFGAFEQLIAGTVDDRDTEEDTPLLTDRERECLLWASHGKTKSEVATILGLGEPTVRTHLLSACRKLNATNVTHAVAAAILHGLISP